MAEEVGVVVEVASAVPIDALARLEAAIAEAGSASAWAFRAGISISYVSDVRLGRRPPGASILAALGLARVVSYVPAAPIEEARS